MFKQEKINTSKLKSNTQNFSSIKKLSITLFLFISFFTFPTAKGEIRNILDTDYLKKENQKDYILGEGDSVKISISQNLEELTDTYDIDSSGKIYFPYLNRIYISGLTLNELNILLNKELLEYIKEPNVESSIISYRPVRVFLEGEIENPGLHTLSGSYLDNKLDNKKEDGDVEFSQSKNYGLIPNGKNVENLNYFPTIFDAIRRAGGITTYSDLSKIVVIRKNSFSNGGGRIQTNVNFLDFFENGNFTQNLRLYDGDFISISKSEKSSTFQLSKAIRSNLNPKFIKVFISGRIENPGVYELTKNSTLQNALDIAGGTKALRGKIYLTRFNKDGTIDKRSIRRNSKNVGKYNNPYLKPGDIIVVSKNPINYFNEIVTEITNPFVNSFALYNIFKD